MAAEQLVPADRSGFANLVAADLDRSAARSAHLGGALIQRGMMFAHPVFG